MIKPAIVTLRKELHRHPELSGAEVQTAQQIRTFIEEHPPTELIDNIGGTGLAAIYEYGPGGKTVAIRCELDALPIAEANPFEHRSVNEGVAHKCGHDGHMAIVAGLAPWLQNQNFSAGKVILLFQPAEETGQGARQVVENEKFNALKVDYIFALHNIPREPLHQIISCQKGFSAEVQSFMLTLKGKESHAAEPENGINPALAISEIIATLEKKNIPDPLDDNFTILTPVHLNMGQPSYGISPANGALHYTIRTWSPEKMSVLKFDLETIFAQVARAHQLDYTVNWLEYFPASTNDRECNPIVLQAAQKNGLALKERPHPFKFGEDFGWYAKTYKTAMFGIGAGINCPALHHADYDFPEELLETGINMFKSIISQIL